MFYAIMKCLCNVEISLAKVTIMGIMNKGGNLKIYEVYLAKENISVLRVFSRDLGVMLNKFFFFSLHRFIPRSIQIFETPKQSKQFHNIFKGQLKVLELQRQAAAVILVLEGSEESNCKIY